MKKEDYKGDFNKDLLEQYKIYIEMMDKISSRRYKSNFFYISLLSGIFAILSLIYERIFPLESSLSNISLIFILIVAVCLCITWFIHIGSFRKLNDAKFEVINEMEKTLPYACYKEEWEKIKEKKYIKLTIIEQIIPIIFMILYIILLIFSIIIFYSIK